MIKLGTKRRCGGCGTNLYADSDAKQIVCPTCGKQLNVDVRPLVDGDQADAPNLVDKRGKLLRVADDVESESEEVL